MRTDRHTLRALFAIALLAATAACGPRVREPGVEILGVRLGSIGLQGGTIHVRLQVTNPNDFGFEASRITYGLELREPDAAQEPWIRLTEGVLEEGLRLGGHAAMQIELPVEFRYRDLGPAVLMGVVQEGRFDYRITGHVDLTRPVRRVFPFRHVGTVYLVEDS